MDKGLEIIDGLWSGRPFRYNGKHNRIKVMTFLPRPVQKPRILIWVVGAWGRPKSMGRVLKYDGFIPVIKKPGGYHDEISPDNIHEMKQFVLSKRKIRGNRRADYAIIKDGKTPTNEKKLQT